MTEKQKALLKWLLTINFGKRKKIIRIFGVYFANSSGVGCFRKLWLARHLWLGNSYYKNYIKTLELSNRGPIPACPPCLVTKQTSLKTKAIAFYLPQFHPIPENDIAWGKGFTEWTNTTKAVPQFENHYQPRLPGELGFYDLRLKSIQERQIELAKHYGVYGFCYYYYWFDGKKLLETPLNSVLENKDLDLPFCLCWANENWTKRWDGDENEVIIEQRHSPESDIAFIKDIEPALKDPRYIKIDGKPIVVVYQPSLLPDFKSTLKSWREYARNCGIGEIYVAGTTAFGFHDYKAYELDGLIQFPPHNLSCPQARGVKELNPDFSGRIFQYSDAAEFFLQELQKYPETIPTAMMGWDNEARKPGRGTIFTDFSLLKYKDWIKKMCAHTSKYKKTEDTVVFINAWNEWAEGSYLEPDRRFGYAYLDATAQALEEFEKSLETTTTI